MKFQEKLVHLRKERKLSQEQLAEKLGVSRQAISRWESGDTTPDMLNILGLCNIFEISADDLIRDGEQREPAAAPTAEATEAYAAARRNNLFRLISAVCFQIGTVCSVIGLCHSNSPVESLLSGLCIGICSALSTYQFVRYGKGCACITAKK